MVKERKNILLSSEAIAFIKRLKKVFPKKSSSELLEYGLWKTYQDPIKILRDQNKELQRKLKANLERIEMIEAKKEKE